MLFLDPCDRKEKEKSEKQSTESKKVNELKNAIGKPSKLEKLYKETCVEKKSDEKYP